MSIDKPPVLVANQVKESGKGCGCVALGCVSIIAVVALVCGGGVHVLFNTSYPLTMLEQAIESEGDVEIEGLTGTASSGIEIEKLSFDSRTKADQWSELRDIRFKYNGIWDSMMRNRFVIEDLSVDSGTIYANIEPWEGELDPEFDEIDVDDLEVESELQSGEISIDNINIRNLKIVNPETDFSFHLEQVSLRDLYIDSGEIQDIGTLTVRCDHLNVDTKDSIEFADRSFSSRLEGTLMSEAHPEIVDDVDFALDFGGAGLKIDFLLSIAQDQFRYAADASGDYRVALDDFSPAQWVDWFGPIPPEQVSLQWAGRRNRKEVTFHEGGSFRLGKTTFNVEPPTAADSDEHDGAVRKPDCVAQAANGSIRADIYLEKRKPLFRIELKSDDESATMEDLWAQVAFESSSFAKLDADQQAIVEEAIETLRRKPPRRTKTPRTVEEKNGDESDGDEENGEGESSSGENSDVGDADDENDEGENDEDEKDESENDETEDAEDDSDGESKDDESAGL